VALGVVVNTLRAAMNAPALYLSDLDGTLLDSSGEVSERTRRSLHALLEAGLPFSVASARSHFSIKKLFGAEMPFRLPIIEFNGAFLTDYASGRHLEVYSLGKDFGEEVFDRVLGAGLRPFVCSFDGREDCLHYDELINPGMKWYEERRRAAGDPRLRRTLDLRGTMSEEVVSLTVMAPDEPRIKALRDELRETYGERLQLFCYENEYSAGNWWLTIHHENASKHIAMRGLKERYAPGALVIAFGDNVNDLAMLQHADVAVAVGNAVEPVRAAAHHVIGTNDEDSVVSFLEARARNHSNAGV
jgi:Cof subfamily protein (haloacid dehalogenase superfamily)